MALTHLSYSSVNKYRNCPKSWKFHYIDGIRGDSSEALRLGSFVHKVFENYLLKNGTDPIKNCYTEEVLIDDEKETSIDFDSGEFCQKIFKNPELPPILQGLKPATIEQKFAVEHQMYFDVPGVEIPIMGYIDCLTTDNIIVDFKTSKSSWSQARADGELQASFYASALYASGRVAYNEPVNIKYIVMVKNKTPKIQVIDTVRTFQDTYTVYNTVSEIWKSIQKEVFYPNASTWMCSSKYCSAWKFCEGGKIL